MNSNPSLAEQILCGIRHAEKKYWRFSKELLKIKPEYLLTVAVAETIADSGFEGITGIDLSVKLEEHTWRVLFESTCGKLNLKEYWNIAKTWGGRRGKVDIFIKHELEPRCYIIELKGMDPSATEVKKELRRFNHFLNAAKGAANLKSCHLAFPTTTKRVKWIQKLAQSSVDNKLAFACLDQHFTTGEDPEDGIPAYYANVIAVQFHNKGFNRTPESSGPAKPGEFGGGAG